MKVITVEAINVNSNEQVVGNGIANEAGKSKNFPTAIIVKSTKPSDVFVGKPYNHEVIVMTALSTTQYKKEYYAPNCVSDNGVRGEPRKVKTVTLPISLPVIDDGKPKGTLFTTTNDLWTFLTAQGGYKALQIPKAIPKSDPKKKSRAKSSWGI